MLAQKKWTGEFLSVLKGEARLRFGMIWLKIDYFRIENKLTAAIEAGPDGKPDWKTRIMCNFVTDYIDVSIYQ